MPDVCAGGGDGGVGWGGALCVVFAWCAGALGPEWWAVCNGRQTRSSASPCHHIRRRRRCACPRTQVRARTSVVPFQAVWEGRQQLPPDYWREFLRAPYVTITLVTLGAYFAHPIMQAASWGVGW